MCVSDFHGYKDKKDALIHGVWLLTDFEKKDVVKSYHIPGQRMEGSANVIRKLGFYTEQKEWVEHALKQQKNDEQRDHHEASCARPGPHALEGRVDGPGFENVRA